jgi:hypothetical protein
MHTSLHPRGVGGETGGFGGNLHSKSAFARAAPAYKNLFGVPEIPEVETPETTPVVAMHSKTRLTVPADHEGFAPRSWAAAPATCGAAIDVPDLEVAAVSDVWLAATMLEPGAKMSTHGPTCIQHQRMFCGKALWSR